MPPPKVATLAQLALLPLASLAWLATTFAVSYTLWRLHWLPDRPEPYEFRTKAAGFLIVLPAIFATLGPALLAANLVAWLIGPWRRTLDREGKEFRGDDFVSAQRGLLKVAAFLFAVMAPLMVLGVLLGHL
jgi:hypothetical protein